VASGYRPLTGEEISELKRRGCSCDDWSKVEVAGAFDPAGIKNTHFGGYIRLGIFNRQVQLPGGLVRPAGITNATIYNCRIGDNVYINNVRNYIANYTIEDNVVIDNVDLLVVECPSSFGNGTRVSLVNEAGGRAIPIYDHISAQVAYILAFYRHRPELIEKLEKIIAEHTASVTSSMGLIAAQARLVNCRIIRNVKVGPAGVLEGIDRLENGSINSCPEDPVYIGPGVCAEAFICAPGARLGDGALISRCFVGQGTVLARQFSATDCVFFANCCCLHGEACSVFAGPFTVTRHKSTLLIAGLFSFFNAGSGTNQSNHQYKLGPVHQGVLERGIKTASESYMAWPARVGAFTIVAGSHYKNPDTSNLPFSYLIGRDGESILVPGANLRNIGLFRDARKWPGRDKRRAPRKLDQINFELLNPYTVGKMLEGRLLLARLKASAGDDADYVSYNNARINKSSIEAGIRIYQMALTGFLGRCLLERLAGRELDTEDKLGEILGTRTDSGRGKWLDLAGMLAPEQVVLKVLDDIEAGRIGTLEQLQDCFVSIHQRYEQYRWDWVADILAGELGKPIEQVSAGDVIRFLTNWKTAMMEFDRLICSEARKEFGDSAQVGYGLDGDEQIRRADFAAVRGTFEDNEFINGARKDIAEKIATADRLITRLEKLSQSH